MLFKGQGMGSRNTSIKFTKTWQIEEREKFRCSVCHWNANKYILTAGLSLLVLFEYSECNYLKLHILGNFWVYKVCNPRTIAVFLEVKMWAFAVCALPDMNDMPGQKDIEIAEKPNWSWLMQDKFGLWNTSRNLWQLLCELLTLHVVKETPSKNLSDLPMGRVL